MGRIQIIFAAIVLTSLFYGCSKNSQQVQIEKPIAVITPSPTPQASPAPAVKLPLPTVSDVREAMTRAFGDVLVIEEGKNNFIAGDFNGDGSEDIAILARPAPGKLGEVNSEMANWIIQDADRALILSPKQKVVKVSKEEVPKVREGESVLAIIHGYGPTGWRNPDARQAYLLKHAAGVIQGKEPSIQEKAIRAMHLPFETEIIKTTRGKEKGFVFWTGGVYAWHPRES
jgi:hypothetical protein